MSLERKRHLAIFLAALLVTGLLVFAGVNLIRWYRGGGTLNGGVNIRKVMLREAPEAVQEAVARLAGSRAAYVMTMGNTTYLIAASGSSGERLTLSGARREGSSGPIRVDLKTDPAGDRLVLLGITLGSASTPEIQVMVDGYLGMIPRVYNAHGLPLLAFPDHDSLLVLSPERGARMSGSAVEVTGYARIVGGRLSVQVFSVGKGRVLGELSEISVAAGSPDWGSFRAAVPISVPAGMTEGVVLIYDRDGEAKLAVPIRFGSK